MTNFDHVIGEFSEQILGKEIKDIESILVSTLSELGYTNHAFHILRVPIFDGGKPQFFVETDYGDEWFELYERRNYMNIDSVVARGLDNPRPFHWGEVTHRRQLDLDQQNFFNIASEFGVANGCSFPMFGANSHAMLSITPDSHRQTETKKLYFHNKLALHTISHIYNNYVGDLLLEEFLAPFSPKLTKRETGILTWSARGKTGPEISQIFSISKKTVGFHQANYMRKLDVTTVQYAVCKAVIMGLIRPFDDPKYDPYLITGSKK